MTLLLEKTLIFELININETYLCDGYFKNTDVKQIIVNNS